MAPSPNDPIRELKAILAEHLPWHGARISFLAQFLLARELRSVSLVELATGFGGKAKVDSHYKRLQRFFRSFEIGYHDLARLLVRIGPDSVAPASASRTASANFTSAASSLALSTSRGKPSTARLRVLRTLA